MFIYIDHVLRELKAASVAENKPLTRFRRTLRLRTSERQRRSFRQPKTARKICPPRLLDDYLAVHARFAMPGDEARVLEFACLRELP